LTLPIDGLKAKKRAGLGYHSDALFRSYDRLIKYVCNGFCVARTKGNTRIDDGGDLFCSHCLSRRLPFSAANRLCLTWGS